MFDIVNDAVGPRYKATSADNASGDGDRQVRLAGPGAPDQHDVAPARLERTGVKRPDQPLVDRGACEHERVDSRTVRSPIKAARQIGHSDHGVRKWSPIARRMLPTNMVSMRSSSQYSLASNPDSPSDRAIKARSHRMTNLMIATFP